MCIYIYMSKLKTECPPQKATKSDILDQTWNAKSSCKDLPQKISLRIHPAIVPALKGGDLNCLKCQAVRNPVQPPKSGSGTSCFGRRNAFKVTLKQGRWTWEAIERGFRDGSVESGK